MGEWAICVGKMHIMKATCIISGLLRFCRLKTPHNFIQQALRTLLHYHNISISLAHRLLGYYVPCSRCY
jgi:hypothetical protein